VPFVVFVFFTGQQLGALAIWRKTETIFLMDLQGYWFLKFLAK